jgi:DNA-3-methyladenine glycosylase
VLIRALEPLEGLGLMAERRGLGQFDGKKDLHRLCTGPGKLCQAMAIDKTCYGLDLCGDRLYIEEGPRPAAGAILAAKRVNVDYAGEAKDYLWRFLLQTSPYVSVKPKSLPTKAPARA